MAAYLLTCPRWCSLRLAQINNVMASFTCRLTAEVRIRSGTHARLEYWATLYQNYYPIVSLVVGDRIAYCVLSVEVASPIQPYRQQLKTMHAAWDCYRGLLSWCAHGRQFVFNMGRGRADDLSWAGVLAACAGGCRRGSPPPTTGSRGITTGKFRYFT